MLVACRRPVVATLLVIVALFSSCTGLTESPYTFVDPGNYYKSEEELESALNSVYADFRNFASNYKTLMILELVTEHAMPAHASKDGVISFNCWQGVNQATTYNIQIWDSGYEMINRCNVVLGRGDGVNMSDEKRNQIYGQARFFRAYTMFVLLRLYGGLAIPESYTVGLDGLEIPRKTVDETYDFIIQDLEYCIANLPTRSQWGSGSYYKASKGAAQALLGDVYLTRGCMDNNNTVYFQEAKKQLGDVINSGEYELLPDYKSLWYWFVEEASKNTKESLLEVQFGPTQVSSLHCNFGINVTDESLGGKMYHRSAISHKDYLSYQDDDVRKQCFLTEYTITGTDTRRYFEPEYKCFSGKGEGKWPSSAPGNMKFYDRT
ncbi:RagB/SusD family nutrient uptake outer membrane protein, partial [Phocaeicola sp.]|uniref:RagB/SusD family nutrient uptake outer membrane protein n=1 Tax=Phocaeicola sp. TaxID=2773926 RepID=UPI003AB665A3